MKTTTVVLSVQKGPTSEAIREAGRFLREGKLVAFPTETVYGLGVHLENEGAVERLYRLKGRDKEKQLTLAIAECSVLQKYGVILSPLAQKLSQRFWPGPLTLLLRNKKGEVVGVRMPGHPVARAVLKEASVPIGLPSANPSGKTPPRSAEEVLDYFDGGIDLLLDGGKTTLGVSSTIVDLTGASWKILREGALSKEEVEKACQG